MSPPLPRAVRGSRPARSWSSSWSGITGALRRAMRGVPPSLRHGPHTKFPTHPRLLEHLSVEVLVRGATDDQGRRRDPPHEVRVAGEVLGEQAPVRAQDKVWVL